MRTLFIGPDGRVERNTVSLADSSVTLDVKVLSEDSLDIAFKVIVLGKTGGMEYIAEATVARMRSSRTDVSRQVYGDTYNGHTTRSKN